MPAQSYYSMDGGRTYRLGRNAFEASVLVWMDALRTYGFDSTGKSGAEHLPWRNGLVRDGELSENCEVTPFESYAYVWGEPGHKTSSTIDAADNFERHMRESTDFAQTRLAAEPPETVEWFYANIYRSFPVPELGQKLNPYLVTTRV